MSLPIFTVFTSSRMEKRSSCILAMYCLLDDKEIFVLLKLFTIPFIEEMYLLILRSIRAVRRNAHLFHAFQCLIIIIKVNQACHQLLVINLLLVHKGLGLINQINGCHQRISFIQSALRQPPALLLYGSLSRSTRYFLSLNALCMLTVSPPVAKHFLCNIQGNIWVMFFDSGFIIPKDGLPSPGSSTKYGLLYPPPVWHQASLPETCSYSGPRPERTQ